MRLPPRSSNLNALIKLSLRWAIKNYVERYHNERNHQGLGNCIPFPYEKIDSATGEIKLSILHFLL
jgi:hypothetical protein